MGKLTLFVVGFYIKKVNLNTSAVKEAEIDENVRNCIICKEELAGFYSK